MRIKLTIQLYLDVNDAGDSLLFSTRILLDTYQTYNYLELNEALDDYVNLYFDIGELYRRKLDQELKGLNDFTKVKEVYQKVVNEMTSEHHLFVKEAFGGFNTKALEEWKKKVIVR